MGSSISLLVPGEATSITVLWEHSKEAMTLPSHALYSLLKEYFQKCHAGATAEFPMQPMTKDQWDKFILSYNSVMPTEKECAEESAKLKEDIALLKGKISKSNKS